MTGTSGTTTQSKARALSLSGGGFFDALDPSVRQSSANRLSSCHLSRRFTIAMVCKSATKPSNGHSLETKMGRKAELFSLRSTHSLTLFLKKLQQAETITCASGKQNNSKQERLLAQAGGKTTASRGDYLRKRKARLQQAGERTYRCVCFSNEATSWASAPRRRASRKSARARRRFLVLR